MSTHAPDATMALFLDLENIALGTRDAHFPRFDIQRVIERLLLKGHIVVKKAYCDFDRYKEFKRDLHEAAFELIEIPHVRQSGKNSADIRMVVDALDLCYTKGHVDTFVILSGDSDFSPLVSKLRENAKKVIGVGVKNSTADLFINNCDEFLYYDDLVRRAPSKVTPPSGRSAPAAAPASVNATANANAHSNVSTNANPGANGGPGSGGRGGGGESVRTGESIRGGEGTPPAALAPEKALALVAETLDALSEEREEDDQIWGSMIKQTLKRRNPGFNERAYGFRSFNDLLIEAQHRGLLKLQPDEKSGGYTVRYTG